MKKNLPLKIICLLLGYSFWYITSAHQCVSLQLSVPLYFDDQSVSHDYLIYAPEMVTVTLTGKRKDLYGIDYDSLAIHINTQKLFLGKNGIIIKESDLFLPESIRLTHYSPSNLVVTVNKV